MKLSDLSEKEIAKRIEQNCGKAWARLWREKDFARVAEQAGMTRIVLMTLLASVAKGQIVGMPEETKDAFRHLKETTKKLSEDIERRAFVGAPPYLKLLTDSMKERSLAIARLLKREGQKEGVDFLLSAILKRNPDFNCWKALSRVLKATGRHITDSGLRAKRDQCFAETPPGDDGPKRRMT